MWRSGYRTVFVTERRCNTKIKCDSVIFELSFSYIMLSYIHVVLYLPLYPIRSARISRSYFRKNKQKFDEK